MFDSIDPRFHPIDIPIDARPEPSELAPIRAFLAEQENALIHAAALLAGDSGKRLVNSLSDRRDYLTNCRSTRRKLDDLRAILFLEHVHDDSRAEAGLFALIDPDDPVVADICLLADGFNNALVRSGLRIDLQQNQKPA